MRALLRLPLLGLLALLVLSPAARAAGRTSQELKDWEFQRDGARGWKKVAVPSAFQSHEGGDFHGVGWYRTTVGPLEVPKGRRLLLHFDAAATQVEVWWGDTKLGSHLGGWMPFRFDVTELARKSPDAKHAIRVRVDDKGGHFGGLWQPVRLLNVPETYIDDLRLHAIGNPQAERIEIDAPLLGTNPAAASDIRVRWRLANTADQWGERTFKEAGKSEDGGRLFAAKGDKARLRAGPPARLTLTAGAEGEANSDGSLWHPWSPEKPNLYEVELSVGDDTVATRAAFRTLVRGGRLFLNRELLGVRALLNEGFYPPLFAPFPTDEQVRKDFAFARAYGFNAIKCVGWVPPKRFLELADEAGIVLWVEYPARGEDAKPLAAEFAEIFAHDRNHPSVVVRSLPGREGKLHDLCREMAPGALIEPANPEPLRTNNPGFVAALRKRQTDAETGGSKLLLLGDPLTADTWTDPKPLLERFGKERPFGLPDFLDGNRAWLERSGKSLRFGGLAGLHDDARHYALLTRKYQIETLRRELPGCGYVVGPLRDTPSAASGLIGYRGQPKWGESAWRWHEATVPLLRTENDRRTITSGGLLKAELLVSHLGPERLPTVEPRVVAGQLHGGVARQSLALPKAHPAGGTVQRLGELKLEVGEARRPARFVVRAILQGESQRFDNDWCLWVIPERRPIDLLYGVGRHASLSAEMARELFPDAELPLAEGKVRDGKPEAGIVLARRLDDRLIDFMEAGGKVVLLPDGQKGSFPLRPHRFANGGPLIPEHPALRNAPRDMLLETQAFDLAGDVIPKVEYLDQVDAIFLLWDNHGRKDVKTHGLVFETRIGKGRLLVSALRHTGKTNAVGPWLLDEFIQHVSDGPPPRAALDAQGIKRLRESARAGTIDLSAVR